MTQVLVAVWDSGEWCYSHSVEMFPDRGEYDFVVLSVPNTVVDVESFLSNAVARYLRGEA